MPPSILTKIAIGVGLTVFVGMYFNFIRPAFDAGVAWVLVIGIVGVGSGPMLWLRIAVGFLLLPALAFAFGAESAAESLARAAFVLLVLGVTLEFRDELVRRRIGGRVIRGRGRDQALDMIRDVVDRVLVQLRRRSQFKAAAWRDARSWLIGAVLVLLVTPIFLRFGGDAVAEILALFASLLLTAGLAMEVRREVGRRRREFERTISGLDS